MPGLPGCGRTAVPYSPGPDLYDLESYYKMLDLYFQFSRKVGLPVQEENLVEERRNTEEEISRILKTECASYTRKCTICGRELPGIIRFPSANAALNVEKEYIPEEDNINVLLGFLRGQITHQRRREWKRELFR